MVSKGAGGSSSGSDSELSCGSDLSDKHFDILVDDIIGKLSIYSDFERDKMTIKNRKDRVKPDRQSDKDATGTSNTNGRHTHGYKPYHYPDERNEGPVHRTRLRPGYSHDRIPHQPSSPDGISEASHSVPFGAFPLLDKPVYQSPSIPRPQQRVGSASPQPDNLNSVCECRANARTVPPNSATATSTTDRDNGNNSEDEYCSGVHGHRDPEPQIDETNLEKLLMEKKGWKIIQVKADGACLFRSVSHQIFGDEEKHGIVRDQVVEYMLKNREHFSPYITEEFDHYLSRKRNPTCYGNHVEIQAIAELYNRPVEIYHDSVEPINVFHADYSKEFPIRLSYHGRVHYNSVVDPFNPSFGCGLGMPNYQPRLAEPELIAQALQESEATQLDDAILREKLTETEQSEIERCIEAQAIRESYYDYLGRAKPVITRKSGSSSNHTSLETLASAPSTVATSLSGFAPSSSTTSLLSAERLSAFIGPSPSSSRQRPIPEELRNMDEDAIVAMVMEQSRQEYLENLRNKHHSVAQDPHEPNVTSDVVNPKNASESSASLNVHPNSACKN